MLNSTPPVAFADVLSCLTPSRVVQVASQLGLSAGPTDRPEIVAARAVGIPIRDALEKLYRGELQKICDLLMVDRSGAVYDQDLVERLLGIR
jgi:hypothetical protein